MNTLKMGSAGPAIWSPEGASDALVDGPPRYAFAPLVMAADTREKTVRLAGAFPGLQALANLQSQRVAVKAKGRILFIALGDVISFQAQGNYVLLERSIGSYLLRDSISMLAEKLGPYGFIRIHRSFLVNVAFVEGIRPDESGRCGLQIKGGKEYTVTRTYKKNLNALAQFWIGTGGFFAE